MAIRPPSEKDRHVAALLAMTPLGQIMRRTTPSPIVGEGVVRTPIIGFRNAPTLSEGFVWKTAAEAP